SLPSYLRIVRPRSKQPYLDDFHHFARQLFCDFPRGTNETAASVVSSRNVNDSCRYKLTDSSVWLKYPMETSWPICRSKSPPRVLITKASWMPGAQMILSSTRRLTCSMTGYPSSLLSASAV